MLTSPRKVFFHVFPLFFYEWYIYFSSATATTLHLPYMLSARSLHQRLSHGTKKFD
jgi:hypothetical protein